MAVCAAEGEHQQPRPAGLLPPWRLPRGQVELLSPEGQVRWERRPGPPYTASVHPGRGTGLSSPGWLARPGGPLCTWGKSLVAGRSLQGFWAGRVPGQEFRKCCVVWVLRVGSSKALRRPGNELECRPSRWVTQHSLAHVTGTLSCPRREVSVNQGFEGHTIGTPCCCGHGRAPELRLAA